MLAFYIAGSIITNHSGSVMEQNDSTFGPFYTERQGGTLTGCVKGAMTHLDAVTIVHSFYFEYHLLQFTHPLRHNLVDCMMNNNLFF